MPFPLRFGIGTGNRKPFPQLAREWQLAEQLGFDTAWVVDHLMASDNEMTPYYEAWSLIAAMGALTSRIRFGVMVSGNTYRNPGLLAKQAVTIDHISNGRLELGLGAGWMEREHQAYSYDFPPVGARIEMLEEAIQVIDSLMTRERTDFDGQYYRFVDAPFEPKPLQRPRVPLVIGAFKPRMIKLAARYADIWNTRGTPADVEPLIKQFQAALTEVGRDPAEVRCSVFAWQHPFASEKNFRDTALAYRELGFTDLIFPTPPDDRLPVMERCAREVIPEIRAMR